MPYIGNSPGTGTRNRFIYTATASQTTFSGADDNGKTLKYADSDYVDVYLNGICLVPVTDYTSTSKTSIVLTQAASLNDTLEVVAYDIATISDTVSKADGGTFEGNVTFGSGADIITETLGTDNVRIGENAGDSIASGGNDNVVIGKNAGTALTTGDSNVAIGHEALAAQTTAGTNTVVGNNAGASNTSGAITAFGSNSLTANTTGNYSHAFGESALRSNTTGQSNIAVGGSALRTNTTGDRNIGIGDSSLRAVTTADNNTAVGHNSGENMTTGYQNTLFGSEAGHSLTTGYGNTFVGRDSGYFTTTGNLNTFVGVNNCGQEVTTGSKNVIIGRYSGNQGGLDIRTSDNNIVLSDGDGNPRMHIDGSGNVVFNDEGADRDFRVESDSSPHAFTVDGGGYGTIKMGGSSVFSYGQTSGTGTFGYAIDNGSQYGSLMLSNNADNGWSLCYANKFAYSSGDDRRLFALNINGGGVGLIQTNSAGTAIEFTASSDRRRKENITDLTNGIETVKQLRPRAFEWITDEDTVFPANGFIADEADGVIPEWVTGEADAVDEDNNPIYQTMDYSKAVPVLTAALQEAIAKIEDLETRVAALEAG